MAFRDNAVGLISALLWLRARVPLSPQLLDRNASCPGFSLSVIFLCLSRLGDTMHLPQRRIGELRSLRPAPTNLRPDIYLVAFSRNLESSLISVVLFVISIRRVHRILRSWIPIISPRSRVSHSLRCFVSESVEQRSARALRRPFNRRWARRRRRWWRKRGGRPRGRWSRERGREDSLRRPQLKRSPDRESSAANR